MRRIAWWPPRAALLATCLAVGCATAGQQQHRSRPTVTTPEIEPRDGQLDLAVVPRPTGDALLLSLWIDAGARDAAVPQIAAVAARLAARVIGPGAGGVAHPDGIELTLPCTRSQLGACIEALQRGLALRAPDAAGLMVVLHELEEGRRRRLASDPGAAADALALQAVAADGAASLLPLGRAGDDSAVTREAVSDFLADHFGESRGLLIAAGHLAMPELKQVASTRLQGAVQARAGRMPRALVAAQSTGAVVAPDTDSHSTIAVLGPDLASVLTISALLQDELDGDGGVTSHVAPVRGGALGLLRLGPADPAATAITLGWVAQSRRVLPPSPTEGMRLDGVWEESRALGLRWVAVGGEADADADANAVGLGLGVTLRPRPDEGSAKRDRSVERADALQRSLAAQLAAEVRPPHDVDGPTATEARVSAVLQSGVRVEIARESGPMAGIALRFVGGPSLEPPTAHGRSTMLASLASSHCDGMGADALRGRLRHIGAHLSPSVDADGWGIVLQVPAEHLQAGMRLAFRCALSPSLRPAHIANVAAAMRQDLGSGRDGRMRHAAAQALSPGAPGLLATAGSSAALSSLGPADLLSARREAVVGRRLQVAVVAPVSSKQLARWVATRLVALPAGEPRERTGTHDGAITPEVADGPEQLVLWRSAPSPGAGAGARSFARIAAQVLAAAGLAAVWHDGGASARGSWAAVGVIPDEHQRSDLAQRVADAFVATSAIDLPAAVSATHTREALQQHRTAAAGSASGRAMALLLEHRGAAKDACIDVATQLWRSAPTVHRVP